MNLQKVQQLIMDVPDFPKKGIVFKDITPVLADGPAFRYVIKQFAETIDPKTTKLLAVESRGFIFGSALAQLIDAGVVLVRKPGKLPRPTLKHEYQLEYGTDTLEVHTDQIKSNDYVVIIDDVLATGGTAQAVETMAKKLGANVLGHRFFMELGFLEGRKKLSTPVQSLITI